MIFSTLSLLLTILQRLLFTTKITVYILLYISYVLWFNLSNYFIYFTQLWKTAISFYWSYTVIYVLNIHDF